MNMIATTLKNIYEFASGYKYITPVKLENTCDLNSSIKEWVEKLVELEDYNNKCHVFKLKLNYTIYSKKNFIFTKYHLPKTLRSKRSELQMNFLIKNLKSSFPNTVFLEQWKDNNREGIKVKIEGKSQFSMIVDSWAIEKYRNSSNLCFGEYSDLAWWLVEIMANIRDDQYEKYKYDEYGDDGIRRYEKVEDLIFAIKNYLV